MFSGLTRTDGGCARACLLGERKEGRKEGGRKDLKGRLDLMVFLAEVRTGGREGEGARRRRRDYIVKTAPFSKFNQGWNMEGRKEGRRRRGRARSVQRARPRERRRGMNDGEKDERENSSAWADRRVVQFRSPLKE